MLMVFMSERPVMSEECVGCLTPYALGMSALWPLSPINRHQKVLYSVQIVLIRLLGWRKPCRGIGECCPALPLSKDRLGVLHPQQLEQSGDPFQAS